MARTEVDQPSDGQTEGAEAGDRNPGLEGLDKLVGTWNVSGETAGRITYEWMEGGFFLIAHGDTQQGGKRTRHIEIIGYDHHAGAAPADVMTSRLYTDRGDTLDYTHEVGDRSMTSSFGAKGAPALFKARWSDDGNTLTGAWEWPGGGYTLTMRRMVGRP